MYQLFVLLISLGIVLSSAGYRAAIASTETPSLAASVKIEGNLTFCGEPVPAGEQEVKERYEKELLLTVWDRAQVMLWLKRSRRYLPYIDETLRKERMPEDLRYVAVAESALRAHAGSSKGAIGYWQFTKSTGRKYGLSINDRIDERRNFFASTRAAVRYFKDLHGQFGSWTLAAAAYNMGEDGLMGEILEQGTNDYYQLYLPLETQRFLFRILSVKVILSAPGKFGFDLSDQDYYPLLEFDEIQVDCSQETPIRIIAQAAGVSFKAIKDLNPEIRGHNLAQGVHKLLIPKGASSGFYQRYSQILEKYLSARKDSVYIVKQGDNLSAIAERFGVPLLSLLIWNRLPAGRPIHPGQKLVIYREASLRGGAAQKADEDASSASPND
jgi:membrane-bound lytic murein transglycosylase D